MHIAAACNQMRLHSELLANLQATQMLGFQSPLRNCEVVREETDVLYKVCSEQLAGCAA